MRSTVAIGSRSQSGPPGSAGEMAKDQLALAALATLERSPSAATHVHSIFHSRMPPGEARLELHLEAQASWSSPRRMSCD